MPFKQERTTPVTTASTKKQMTEMELYTYFNTLRKDISAYLQGLDARENYLTNKSYGYMHDDRRELIDVYESVMRDPHLKSTLLTLRAKVLGRYALGYLDLNSETDKPDKHFPSTYTMTGSVAEKMIGEILDSEFFGYTLLELGENNNETKRLKSVETVERRNIYPDENGVCEYAGSEISWVITDDIFKDDYILFNDKTLGLLADIAPIALAKKASLQAYVSFTDTFSKPIVHGKTDDTDQGGKQRMADDLANSVSNRILVTDLDDELKVVEMNQGAGSDTVFTSMLNFANAEMSKLIVGSISVGGEAVAYKGSSQQNYDVFTDRVESYRLRLTNNVNEKVIPVLQRRGILPPNKDGKVLVMYFNNNLELSAETKIKLLHELYQSGKYYIDESIIEKEFGLIVEKYTDPELSTESNTDVEAFLKGL